MQGLPLLLEEPHVAGVRDSEKTFSPDITEVKVIVSGVAKKVYSQGMKTRDMCLAANANHTYFKLY